MTETKRPLKVFLCHAHADRDPVRALYARLTQDGVDRYAWLDKKKTPPRAGSGTGNSQGYALICFDKWWIDYEKSKAQGIDEV